MILVVIKGYDVNYIRNITDIDDKIINRANENGEHITDLVDRFVDAMTEDFDKLGIERKLFYHLQHHL